MVCCWVGEVGGVVVLPEMVGRCEMRCPWLLGRMAEARLVGRRGRSWYVCVYVCVARISPD